ncbi:PREDICTED: uncharacterized protein LOC105368376 [Ceratosolen solmsi marchali]|uniref:Uncharacterized protein LOC105368376 n=1 Tax=Ceratosolen solmsi marchali TaxID=326594 RepID=A0AAJ6YWL0_9HYME|nr:PREDICTED: uncharacterized protein LOC105368376 [Ceratosolen solmsi marchali]
MEYRNSTYVLLVNIGVFIFIMNFHGVTSKYDVQFLNNYVTVNPIQLWRFLDTKEEEITERFSETIQELTVDRIKCLRYCIGSNTMMNQRPRTLDLNWNLEEKKRFDIGSTSIFDKESSEIHQGKLFKSNNSQNLQNECMFSIIAKCEIPHGLADNVSNIEKNFINSLQPNFDIFKDSDDNGRSSLNYVNEKLVDKTNLMNETEIDFHVQRHQVEINAVVLGNISKIDLKMPFATTQKPPQLTLATTRMPDGVSGLQLKVLNPPFGGWRIGLFGASNETYRVVVTSFKNAEFSESEQQDYFKGDDMFMHIFKVDDTNLISQQIESFNKNNKRINWFNNRIINRKFASKRSDEYILDDQIEPISFKFPETNDDKIMNISNGTMQFNTAHTENRMIDRGSFEIDDLNRSSNDELPIKKHLIIDINPNTNLIASPGTNHLVTFDITNNHVLTVRHYFTPRSSPLRIVATIPPYRFVEIGPSQTISVVVVVQIPPTITDSVLNTVTLQVQGIENLEKSAELHVRTSGSRLFDDMRPTIYYYFNNNCAGRNSAEKCLKSYWSMDITIQDSDSGLKNVMSVPKGIYPRYQYVSGTSNPVQFYYSNNCCNRAVEITATDLAGNVFSKKIDVNEWNNLMDGEIAAITVGVLFVILLTILLILLILYCSYQRKSHDLTYSQRYGSRTAPRSE